MVKIKLIGEPKIIMQNPKSKHHYFGWPTITKLQNGKIAVVSSGYRVRHVCPFGKTVISYSEDDGKSYTPPAIVIDTALDDRDGGILAFGKSGAIVTSFNNTVDFQRKRKEANAYDIAYLNTVTPEEEARDLGSNFVISNDYAVTFGEIHKSPVTSPHGPIELSDGTLLWVGRTFSPDNSHRIGIDRIEAHKINLDGSMEFVGKIDNIDESEYGFTPLSCEPHAIELPCGSILTHIRVHNKNNQRELLTIYQSISNDKGKTWSKPERILDKTGGAPSHILRHSSGALISTYGYRCPPFTVRAMFSFDNGKTWDKDKDIYVNGVSIDLGYPSTIELSDGSLLTIFYACPEKDGHGVIMQQKWRFENE